MNKQSVFITGGAGFIGRCLAKRCLRDDYDVTVYDNLCAGSRENIREFGSDITFYEADILDTESLKSALQQATPDIVFHLAAHHFIPFCNSHPQETLKVNVEGSYNVLQSAADVGTETAVVASSGALYPSLDTVLNEDIEAQTVDVYGLTKHLTEQVAEHIGRTEDMTCVAARLFNTYGPYETNPHLIPHIMESLHEGPTVELGNIHTKRDYIYVEDVAGLLLRLAEADLDGYQVANVGTGIEYSAKEIVDTIGDLLSSDITIQVDEDRVRSVDKLHQRASVERLEELAGTGAQYSLEEGLTELLRHEQLLRTNGQARDRSAEQPSKAQ